MSERTEPLAGPIDDEPAESPTHGQPSKKTEDDDDGSEWIPEARPAEGEGPLP
jgi:hypothetical protein